MKVKSITTLVLLVCGLQLHAQQTDSPSRPMGAQCGDRPCSLSALITRYRQRFSGTQALSVPSESTVDANSGTFTTFDVPGDAQGTYPYSINAKGLITGYYGDSSGIPHGFVRAADGTITTFDVTGAVFGTNPYAINTAGIITGWYYDPTATHGFLRTSDGRIKTFDVPGSSGTWPIGIDSAGTITGIWYDASGVNYGFLRSNKGTFTSFDLPGGEVINLSGIINPGGEVTGYYFDQNQLVHSYVWADGTLTTFDAPNVCQTSNGTFAVGINRSGVIAGVYYDAGCADFHGFLRSADGTLTTVDFPGAQATTLETINASGTSSGTAYLSSGFTAFYRTPSGKFVTYSIPGPTFLDTSLNSAGSITGSYQDSNGATHGYLWTKQ